MDKAKKIVKALEKAGLLEENKICTLSDGTTGIMVSHDYNGMYPTLETHKKHIIVVKIAARYHCRKCEPRGFYKATLIYI